MLRPYQQQLESDIITALQTNNSVMAVLPTGGGKTLTASIVTLHYDKVLWIAHRKELLEQASEALIKVGHENFAVKSVFADPPSDEFGLLVCDETHHASAPTLQKFLISAKYKKLLGITATPFRLDRLYLNFDKIIYGASINTLTEQKYLVPIDLYTVKTNGNKLQSTINWLVVNREIIGKTVLFVLNLAEAEQYRQTLAPHFNVEVISGISKRPEQLSRFMTGNTNILISCAVLTEGVDIPCISTVVLARNTDSEGLLRQMVGRGLRPFPDKDHCKIVQIVNNKTKSIANIINPRNHYISTYRNEQWNTCRLGDRLL